MKFDLKIKIKIGKREIIFCKLLVKVVSIADAIISYREFPVNPDILDPR